MAENLKHGPVREPFKGSLRTVGHWRIHGSARTLRSASIQRTRTRTGTTQRQVRYLRVVQLNDSYSTNSRSHLCRAVGLKATITAFTATASQKLAVKSGFKDLVVVSYDEIAEKNPEFYFPGINDECKILRYMYKMID